MLPDNFSLLVFPCFIAAGILYVPGFLFFRGLHFSRLISTIAAPIVSIACYGLAGIINQALGLSSSLVTVFGPVLLVALVLWVIPVLSNSNKPLVDAQDRSALRIGTHFVSFEWVVLLCYVLLGSIVCLVMFTLNLADASNFYSRYDNQTHLNLTKCFLDTGQWSSLHTNRYLDLPSSARPVVGSGSFYPASWHAIVALVCLASGKSVALCTNAVFIVLASVSLPAGLFLLNKTLFSRDKLALALGAIVSVSFANLPWVFILRGPTFPNMLGFVAMVPVLAIFVLFCEHQLVRKRKLAFAVFCFLALAALGLSHPSTVFSAFVFLAAYGAHYLNSVMKQRFSHRSKNGLALRIAVLGVYLIGIVGIWVICLYLPPLQSVLNYHYNRVSTVPRTILSLFSFSFGISHPQIALPLVCLVGYIACIAKRRWWLLFPPTYTALLFFIARLAIQPATRIFTGFWYSTPYRLHSFLAVFLVPVASIGIAALVRLLGKRVAVFSKQKQSSPHRQSVLFMPQHRYAVISAFVAVLFVLLQFTSPLRIIPWLSEENQTGAFKVVANSIHDIYDPALEQVYSAEERNFVDRVATSIPNDALVINQPADGSVFAYGANDVTIYFRSIKNSGLTDDANIIRTQLVDYATDTHVQKAVRDTGAQYVLLLDQDVPYEDGTWMPQTESLETWDGLNAISDNTAGFETVLAEDDMRLYRIVPIEELAAAA